MFIVVVFLYNYVQPNVSIYNSTPWVVYVIVSVFCRVVCLGNRFCFSLVYVVRRSTREAAQKFRTWYILEVRTFCQRFICKNNTLCFIFWTFKAFYCNLYWMLNIKLLFKRTRLWFKIINVISIQLIIKRQNKVITDFKRWILQ